MCVVVHVKSVLGVDIYMPASICVRARAFRADGRRGTCLRTYVRSRARSVFVDELREARGGAERGIPFHC